jgi:ABC-type molybdate transport system ATPase subunit
LSTTSHKYNTGDKVTFGIRQEDVMIMRPELIKKGDNLLSGLITAIYPKGSSVLAIFVPHNSGCTIEIDMPEYAATKLNLKISMPVTVSFRSERLFVLR